MEKQSSESATCIHDADSKSFAFNFPFQPYQIQVDLMKVAYDTYENSKFALLESPTGTGKSMSLICSSLTWLKDYQQNYIKNLEDKKILLQERIEELKKEEASSNDWLNVQTKRQDVIRELAQLVREFDKTLALKQKKEARWHAKIHNNPLENYHALAGGCGGDKKQDSDIEKQDESHGLIGSQGSQTSQTDDEDIEAKIKSDEEESVKPKIYYASRTISQLSQFINEVKKTNFAQVDIGPSIGLAPLASRSNLCVNPDVLKLKDSSAINERCAEMQRESNAEKRCPFMKAKQVNMLKEDILSEVQDIEDIARRGRAMGACAYYAARMSVAEADMVVLPYNNLLHHETRKASLLDLKDSVVIIDEAHNILETICSIHSAQITGQQLIGSHTILSRYHQKFRSRMNPRNALIIQVIVMCLTALIKYLDNPKKHIQDYEVPKQIEIDDELLLEEHCDDKNVDKGPNRTFKCEKHEEFMIDVSKFIGSANIEQFNVFKIIDYFSRSQLARKLLGFFRQDSSFDLSLDLCDSELKQEVEGGHNKLKRKAVDNSTARKKKKTTSDSQPVEENQKKTSLEFLRLSNPDIERKGGGAVLSSYPIYALVEFLRSLTNLVHDGRVLTDHVPRDILQSVLRFILLNPSSQFKQMTEEARSIVLAGGTMQPFGEFTELLFEPLGISRNRLTTFSCGHVIGPKQLYVASLSYGSTGKPLELSYKTRSSYDTIDELGRTVMNVSCSVPGGVVCFLPSYDYETLCFNRWTQIGVIANIERRSKHVFREPKQASHVKPILEEYARMIEKGKSKGRGALLFCVVGGKMSEGINFNDDLGRCVVMIGLPYANIKSSELQQKMSYYDRTCVKKSQPEGGMNQQVHSSAGQQYYENLCIKGINQSIGRAVRHKNDYAAIILLDRRYSSKLSIKNGLPKWMLQSLVHHERFGPMFAQLKSFYANISQTDR